MKNFFKRLFHYHDTDSTEAIVASTNEVMMMLNNDFSIKAQDEIIIQVISNTIQLRYLEIVKLENRIKDLTEGKEYLESLVKNS